MIPHPRANTEQWDSEEIETVLAASLRILDEVGLRVLSPRPLSYLAEAGGRVDAGSGRIRLDPDTVLQHVRKAPSHWTFSARNPARYVTVGGRDLLVSPGYGSAFVADAGGIRRPARLEDFRRFASLAGCIDAVDITGGLLVEPCDVPPGARPVETTRALIAESDKPFLGSVAGAEGARDSLEMARILFGDLSRRTVVAGLININSPLRLDGRMADALLEYAAAGQGVILTPGIMMGITAPVTVAGAMSQAFAELLGCVAMVQVIRPGTPVVIGLGGFGADLRTAGSGFGRPEQALAQILGAQMARRLGLPYRASPCVTGAMAPDCRSGYERMMTTLGAWSAGVHLCMQGLGILDSINSMSFEQFVIDAEVWGYVKRIARGATVDEETLAFEAIAAAPTDYLTEDHTLRNFREALHTPLLAPPVTYDAWIAEGGPDVRVRAEIRLRELLAGPGPEPPSKEVLRDLDAYVGARRKTLRA